MHKTVAYLSSRGAKVVTVALYGTTWKITAIAGDTKRLHFIQEARGAVSERSVDITLLAEELSNVPVEEIETYRALGQFGEHEIRRDRSNWSPEMPADGWC